MSNQYNISERIPEHIAIIMDGNGRWAQTRKKIRTFGHQNSEKAIKETIEGCLEKGVKYLTLYAFSKENWYRPKTEVSTLIKLINRVLKSELKELTYRDIRFRTIGDIDDFSEDMQKNLRLAEKKTENNNKMVLTLALSYGAKAEMVRAIKQICKETKENNTLKTEIDDKFIEKYLYTKGMPPVDLMIRTGGEYRISNFLLWQSAYAELYFTNILWPDFRKESLFTAIKEYQSRERRFGKVLEKTEI